jgi:hypothetical protein
LLGIPPDEEDRVMEEVAEFIPACVAAIDDYWRAKRQRQASISVKKFKKCCGKVA